MKLKYAIHALLQLKRRGITKKTITEIHKSPEFTCFDTHEQNFVAVKQILHKEKVRYVSVSYNKELGHDKITTFKPEKTNNLFNKIKKGRWVKL